VLDHQRDRGESGSPKWRRGLASQVAPEPYDASHQRSHPEVGGQHPFPARKRPMHAGNEVPMCPSREPPASYSGSHLSYARLQKGELASQLRKTDGSGLVTANSMHYRLRLVGEAKNCELNNQLKRDFDSRDACGALFAKVSDLTKHLRCG